MPSFVVIISLLSLMSFLYSMKVFNQEAHRLELVTRPLGGTVPRMVEQVLRVCIAALFTALSLISVLMSLALIWLALQPAVVG
jgi:hypothetical protein